MSEEEGTPNKVVGMFDELRIMLQEMRVQVHRQERTQQNISNEMNRQLRDINCQLQNNGRVGRLVRRLIYPKSQANYMAFMVDRGAYNQELVRFERGISFDMDQVRRSTEGQ